jgi:hypothetical protein
VPATRRDQAGLRLAGRRATGQPGEGPRSGLPPRELLGIRRAETTELCFWPQLRPGLFGVSGVLRILGALGILGARRLPATGSLCW